uniref:TraB domain-containing protein n=1 Tax=Panagrellus redivivus TaxID=6233 RepID=A0A7E4UYF4_PANRE
MDRPEGGKVLFSQVSPPIYEDSSPVTTEGSERSDSSGHFHPRTHFDNLSDIGGEIQTVPSLPNLGEEANAQLTESDIFDMKNLNVAGTTSEMQSNISVVDSMSVLDDRVPESELATAAGTPEEAPEEELKPGDVSVEPVQPLVRSSCGRYAFCRTRVENPVLPSTVTELTYPFEPRPNPGDMPFNEQYRKMFKQSKVYIVGTAHFSKQSQQDVYKTIRAVQPDVVFIELCASRYTLLTLSEESLLRDASKLTADRVLQMVRENGVSQGLLHALMLSTSAMITRELGMAPGGEFRAAFHSVNYVPACRLVMGDRPISITFQRAISALSLYQKAKVFINMILSGAKITPEDIERCKQRDLLEEILAEMAGEYPQLTEIFVNERDQFLVYNLRQMMERYTAAKIDAARVCGAPYQPFTMVAVVGVGHVPGMVQNWESEIDIERLVTIPERTFTSKVVGFTIRLAVVGSVVYGVYRLGRFTHTSLRPYF